jgi:hypothetical protein
MANVGAPRIHNREEIRLKLLEYIENNEIPILAEFAYQNDISRDQLYDWPELTDARKKCILKKEAQLEKGALSNQINVTMAIFSLKQMGWTDKQESTDAIKIEIVGGPE